MGTIYRTMITLTAAIFATALLTSCSDEPERSVAAYCSTFYGEGKQFRAQYQGKSTDLLTEMAQLISAPQELATFFAKLDKVAPNDIEPDVAALHESFQKQSDNLGDAASNPLKGMLTSLIGGISSTGSWNRVDSWTLKNCGPPPRN